MNVRRVLPSAALALVFLAGPVLGDAKVGETAPEIAADKWYNVKGDVSLEKLRGKVVVVEYWATW